MTPRLTHAFTLVELMVTVTIIVILVALLIPAIESAAAAAKIGRCAANQRGILTGSTAYASENQGDYFISRGRQVFHVFDGQRGRYSPHSPRNTARDPGDRNVNWAAALATVGLAKRVETRETDTPADPEVEDITVPVSTVVAGPTNTYTAYQATQTWMCPTVDLFGSLEPLVWSGGTLVGYQYLGGFEYWRNTDYPTFGDLIAPSPINVGLARPGWVLTGDLLFKDNRLSVNPWYKCHPAGNKDQRPAGGNYGYVDGSVYWASFYETFYAHTWNTVNYVALIAQTDLGGYVPSDSLKAENFD